MSGQQHRIELDEALRVASGVTNIFDKDRAPNHGITGYGKRRRKLEETVILTLLVNDSPDVVKTVKPIPREKLVLIVL